MPEDRSAAATRDRLRVAYVSSDYPTISHTFIQTEILGLAAHGVDVEPFALNPSPEAVQLTDVDRAEAARTWYVKSAPKGRILRTVLRAALTRPVALGRTYLRLNGRDVVSLPRLAKRTFQFVEGILVADECRRRGISHLHAHMGGAPATVTWYAAEIGSVMTGRRWTWSLTVHGWSEFVDETEHRLREKLVAASRVIAISDFTRSQLMRIAPTDAWDRIVTVRCGVDLQRFAPRSDAAMAAASAARTIVVTARLAPEKGHSVLLDAVALLRDRGVDCRVRLVGSGPMRDELRRTVDRLRLGDRVEFTGALPPEQVAAELRGAGVFCLPTFAEGLPIVLMEAAAIGVPLVTTYIAGIPELVDHDSGHLVPAGRADLLADALAEALDDGPARTERLRVAAARVTERHDARRNLALLADELRVAHGGAT
jgi:glycosyltransferase involved in cell wall biosynthesis